MKSKIVRIIFVACLSFAAAILMGAFFSGAIAQESQQCPTVRVRVNGLPGQRITVRGSLNCSGDDDLSYGQSRLTDLQNLVSSDCTPFYRALLLTADGGKTVLHNADRYYLPLGHFSYLWQVENRTEAFVSDTYSSLNGLYKFSDDPYRNRVIYVSENGIDKSISTLRAVVLSGIASKTISYYFTPFGLNAFVPSDYTGSFIADYFTLVIRSYRLSSQVRDALESIANSPNSIFLDYYLVNEKSCN